jgi:putative two-component system response regulator
MSQKKVRNEIENFKGKQFDPIIAQIMIEMIDEDINYKMKEK